MGYDPLGRCVKRWVGPSGALTSNPATYLYYEGWNLIQEGNGGGNGVPAVVRYFFHGGRVDEIVGSWRQTGNTWLFHHYDARTHCVALTNSGQSIVEQYAYDAFGKTYFYDGSGNLTYANGKNDSPQGNRFLFTGREWLSDWGVYDYRHRQYHPELGRFIQPDPQHFVANDYNLYRYCHNDPINKIDPIGLDEINLVPQTGKDREISKAIDKVPPKPDYFQIAAHGSAKGLKDSNGNVIPPHKLVGLIMRDANYSPEKVIQLNVCWGAVDSATGTATTARYISTKLPNEVRAADSVIKRHIQMDQQGNFVSDKMELKGGGVWVRYKDGQLLGASQDPSQKTPLERSHDSWNDRRPLSW